MVVHPQLLQSDRQWHQSIATVALLAAVLWIGSLDRKETNALAVSEIAKPTVSGPVEPAPQVRPAARTDFSAGTLLPKAAIVKDRQLMMRLYEGVDREGR